MKTREEEIANLKKIIKLFYNPEFKGGLYNLRNVVGDKMTNIYKHFVILITSLIFQSIPMN